MQGYINEKVLLSTSNWFFAPDGKQYKSIWGTLKGVHEAKNLYGFVPNRNHANWVIEIGNMMMMGCQVLYCAKCPTQPPAVIEDYVVREFEMNAEAKKYLADARIYIAPE